MIVFVIGFINSAASCVLCFVSLLHDTYGLGVIKMLHMPT